jgi:Ca2+-binding RTX toxin-like protein
VNTNMERSKFSLALGIVGATIALAVAALVPASASAQFATFSNGVLTIHSSEGKVVPRCESDGTITVTGATPDGGGLCSELRRIEADSIVNALFDFSQLPDNLGGGQGPITIHAFSLVTDPTEISDDKFIGAPGHINVFEGGLGFDSLTGGNLNDTLSGGADSDKIDGGGGNDTIRGGAGGDKLIGGLGADSLFGGGGGDKLLGGPGPDFLKGGGGSDKLVGGPGKDHIKQ